jgi:hypothetical protein
MLVRVSGLPALAFDDGTPLSDATTTAWLDTEVLPAASGQTPAGDSTTSATASAPTLSALDAAIIEGRSLVEGGDVEAGLRRLMHAAASETTPSLRFRGRLAVAQLCLQAEQLAIAIPQLDELRREVDEMRIELSAWDPGLCAEVHAAWYLAQNNAHLGRQPTEDVLAGMRASFKRVCQLDPIKALTLLSV